MIVDGKGEIASVEFLNGKLIYHSGSTMPVNALADSTKGNICGEPLFY